MLPAEAPPAIVPPGFPPFVCPRCRGPLRLMPDAYHCAPCAGSYPIVLGIADFRLDPDPWISLEEDREKGRRLAERSAGADLAGTVRAYWEMTPGTSRARAEHFTARVLAAEARAADWLDWMARVDPVPGDGVWLDIGCGTADLVAAVTGRGGRIVGVDIAFRWLVAARARGTTLGGRAVLACANGEHLPFADGSFTRVLTAGTLEHCRDAGRVISEGRRVLSPGGAMRVRTVNRYTPLREPHVGIWGVGFVPRRWADAYVRWRGGQGYQHHRPLSPRELTRDLRRAGFGGVRVAPAPLLASDRRLLRGPLAWAGRLYGVLRALPLVGTGLAWISPELETRVVARSSPSATLPQRGPR